MRKRRRKIQTVRFPDDVKKRIDQLAAETGWSFNASCAALIRIGQAAFDAEPSKGLSLYADVLIAIETKKVRDRAEEQIRKIKQNPRTKKRITQMHAGGGIFVDLVKPVPAAT